MDLIYIYIYGMISHIYCLSKKILSLLHIQGSDGATGDCGVCGQQSWGGTAWQDVTRIEKIFTLIEYVSVKNKRH